MNHPQRLKIRNTARILHWVTLLVIGLVVVAGLVIRSAEPVFIRVYFEKPLRRASEAVVDGLSTFYNDRTTDLTSFLPPVNPDAMVAWAGKMQAYLGQPAAVFIREGSSTTWINVPPEMQAALDKVPRLFVEDGIPKGRVDTLGAFERRRSRVEVDSVGYTVWIVGPLEDSLRWGAVVRFEESWRPFFAELQKGAASVAVSPLSRQLNAVLQVENVTQEGTSRTGMRAFLHDVAVYRTPGVDTTHHMFPLKLGGYAKLEYYLSDEDQRAMDYFLSAGFSWLKLLLLAGFGAVVHLFWRWVRVLTAPPD